MNFDVQYGTVFAKTRQAFEAGKKIIIHQGGTGCFTGETLVRTISGYAPICKINEGDYVLTGENHFKKVIKKYSYRPVPAGTEMIEFTLKDNSKFKCTYNHEIKFNSGWISAIELAKRKMETDNGKILHKRFGKDSFNQLEKHRQIGYNEAIVRGRRVFTNNDFNGWGIPDSKDSSISGRSISAKSTRQAPGKSYKFQHRGQQGGKFGVGDSQGKLLSFLQSRQICLHERIVKWDGKIERGAGIGDKTKVQSGENHKENAGRRIQRFSGLYKGYSLSLLAAREIKLSDISHVDFLNYNQPVYDLHIEDDHSYCITQNNFTVHNSGKTVDLMIFFIFFIALRIPNVIITIVSESKPHLDIGVIRILKDQLKKTSIFNDSDWNISTSIYSFANGSIIEFFSADRIGKALGARRDYLFGNEINSLKFDVWDELARRSTYIFGDFNPVSEFWLDKFLSYYGDHALIKSNYLDNPFIPDTERQRIIRRAGMDANFKRIHIDCEYGIFEGLIFTDWEQIDEFPDNCKITKYGLDFGYSNNPSALIKTGIIDNRLYADEIFYKAGMINSDIRKQLSLLNLNGHEVIADSAEPKSIEEIYRDSDGLGKFNVKPAVKGADSINFGIDKIKEYKLFVTKRSVNLIKELRNYSWAKDKNGNLLNKPIDDYNHGIDAMRYAISQKTKKLVKVF